MDIPGFKIDWHNGHLRRAYYRTLELYSTTREGDLGVTRHTHFLYRGETLRCDGLKAETILNIMNLIANDLGLPPAVPKYIPCEFCHLVPATHTHRKDGYRVCLACSLGPRANNDWVPIRS